MIDLSASLDAQSSGYYPVEDAAGRYLIDHLVIVEPSGVGDLIAATQGLWRSKVAGAYSWMPCFPARFGESDSAPPER